MMKPELIKIPPATNGVGIGGFVIIFVYEL